MKAAGGDPDTVDHVRLAKLNAAGSEVLRQLADDPALLAQFQSNPAAALAVIGIDAGVEPAPMDTEVALTVVSQEHNNAATQFRQEIIQRLGSDAAWAAAFRVDPIAAIIDLGHNQPPTITAAAIRALSAPPKSTAPTPTENEFDALRQALEGGDMS